MANKGPVMIIEDDKDDIEILSMIIKDSGFVNRIVIMEKTSGVIPYLRTLITQPFLIMCDINMPQKDGMSLKREIDDDPYLREKAIPFVFYTSVDEPAKIARAYAEFTIQGFFIKESSIPKLQQTVSTILSYWTICKHPDSNISA